MYMYVTVDNLSFEIRDCRYRFNLSTFVFTFLQIQIKSYTMGPEPVHGNLSHAMRDNYAEHGVDQVRP